MAMKVLRSKWPNRSITCLTLCALINSTVYVIAYKTRPIWFLFGTLLCITVIRPKQLLNNCHEIKLEDLSKDPWHLTFGYHLVCYPWIAAFFFQNENIQQKDPLRYDNNTIYFYVVIKIVSVNAISFRILLSWKYVCLSKKKRNVCHIYIVVILFMFYHSLAVSHS